VRVSNIFKRPSAATVEIRVGVCGEKVALYICEEWAGIVRSDVVRDVDHYFVSSSCYDLVVRRDGDLQSSRYDPMTQRRIDL
jgi:hypothetical protein